MKTLGRCIATCAIFMTAAAQAQAQAPWQPPSTSLSSSVAVESKTATGATFRRSGTSFTITFWNDRTVHITSGTSASKSAGRDLAIVGVPKLIRWSMSENDSRFLLTTSAMQITVDKKSGAVAMLGEDGAPIIAESDPLTQKMGSTPDLDGAVQQRFRLEGSQGIYGLGQHQTGVLDLIGTTTRLQQANTDVGVPVLVSTRGYGLFWNWERG